MKNIFFIFLLMLSTSAFPQKYLKGNLILNDGSIVTGEIVPPDPHAKKIKFKLPGSKEKRTYTSEEVNKVTFIFEDGDGESVGFEKVKIFKMMSGKVKAGEFWMQKVVSGYATLYSAASGMIYARGTKSTSDINYYIQREGEEAASLAGSYTVKGAFNVNHQNNFRMLTSKYFKDSPEFVERIKNKEFKVQDADVMVEEYNKWYKARKKI